MGEGAAYVAYSTITVSLGRKTNFVYIQNK
jgi:hypothetical protein